MSTIIQTVGLTALLRYDQPSPQLIRPLYKSREASRSKSLFIDPFNPVIQDSYVGEATRQLSTISRILGQDKDTREKLLRALEFSGGDWGQHAIPRKLSSSDWFSDVSNDHSPLEYSLALSQRTGEAELRFLIEAQPKQNNLASLQKSTNRLNNDIANEYGSLVSLDHFNLIRDLFFPTEAQGNLAAWHSFAVSKTLEKWKIYLNPRASGVTNAPSLTREALTRLGLEESWEVLSSIMSDNDSIIYFALGMSPDPEDAEVKVYVSHPGSSATQIAEKHAKIDPNVSISDIEQFYSCMARGSLGPYPGKPPISCFAFKNKDPRRPARTVLYPMDTYASNDADAQERIETYMRAISAPALYRERYRNTINAVRRRPLASGRGIHSWVSMKEKPDGKRSNTYYLSAELFGCLS